MVARFVRLKFRATAFHIREFQLSNSKPTNALFASRAV